MGQFQSATKEDIDQAVAAARQAFDHGPWREVTRKDRAKNFTQN
ncbi:aldehyde dehydrogenase family protein [Peribacillus frigoritolerans]|nr:aldehyde dehydrogenase family protein [Peribacillus frigoritolerans]